MGPYKDLITLSLSAVFRGRTTEGATGRKGAGDKLPNGIFEARAAQGNRPVSGARGEKGSGESVQKSGETLVRGRKLAPSCVAGYARGVYRPVQLPGGKNSTVLRWGHDYAGV